MKVVHVWRYKKPTYGGAGLWFGPLEFRISTGSTWQIHVNFKIHVNFRRTLLIRSDKLWSFKVLAYKGSLPRMK